ncbi:MAG: sugar lactone lactonase YvrE, partial [Planctomycetota bacterium]
MVMLGATKSWSLVLLATCAVACGSGPQPDFSTPASCCYDADNDVYLVSNIQGASVAKDDNGFILKVSPEHGTRSKWISGDQTGVTLHAPKGMAISGDVLWVADIDMLRKFNRNSGAPMGDVAIPGATFLSDVSAGPDGNIYCTDSGLNEKLEPTGTDAIWRVTLSGKVTPVAKGEALGQPSGLSAQKGGIFVVSWRDGTFYQINYRGVRTDLGKAPQHQLDGLVRVELETTAADGTMTLTPAWFTTSWKGRSIYRFALTG